MGCGEWLPAQAGGCEACGWERPGWNRALHVAALNRNLYDAAEKTLGEDARYKQSVAEEVRMAKRYGIEPAPMRPSPITPAPAKLLSG